MDVVALILVITVALSGLTYAMGALIYALPIPVRGLKRWGPLLIKDAVLSLILATSFGALLFLLNQIFIILGVSRSELVSDVGTIATDIARLYLFFKMISIFYNSIFSLKVFGLPIGKIAQAIYLFFSQFQPVGNWASSFTLELLVLIFKLGAYAWSFVYIMCIVSSLVLPFAIASGALMIGFPFRILKSAGASLIGFAVATYVLMPMIVLLLKALELYSPALKVVIDIVLKLHVNGPRLGVVYPEGKVIDAQGKPVGYTYIVFKDNENHYGIYPVGPNGYFTTRVPLGGAPWPVAYVYVDLYGLTYFVGRVNFESLGLQDGSTGSVTIKLVNAYVPSPGVAVRGNVKLLSFSSTTDTKKGVTYLYFKIEALDNTKVTIVVTGVLSGNVNVYASSGASNGLLNITTWEGMPEYLFTFDVNKGSKVDVVVYGDTGSFKAPKFYVLGYIASALSVVASGVIMPKSNYSVDYVLIVPFIVSSLPLMHTLLVAAVGRAIASLISEGSKSLIVRMW